MSTARKLPAKTNTKRRRAAKRPPEWRSAAGEPWPKPLTKKQLAEKLRWLDEEPPIKPKRPIEGEELEEAIRTGGL